MQCLLRTHRLTPIVPFLRPGDVGRVGLVSAPAYCRTVLATSPRFQDGQYRKIFGVMKMSSHILDDIPQDLNGYLLKDMFDHFHTGCGAIR